MSHNADISVSGDNRGIIAGRDIRDTNLIQTGDIQGSYNAIGAGAQIVVHQIQPASPAAEAQRAQERASILLAHAVRAKAEDYVGQIERGRSRERSNPYQNLPAYSLVDAPFFYGREQAVTALLDALHRAPLTVLHAASGAGKSSLLQAGIMARLLAAGHLPLYIRTRGPGLGLAALDQAEGRPRPAPAFSDLIKAALVPDMGHDPAPAMLRQMSLLGFLTAVRRQLGDSSLYVFLDQFEDFFDDAHLSPRQRAEFARELNACRDEPGLDVRWVISLRKESYSDLVLFGDHIFHNQLYLPGLASPEATAAMEEPARLHGVTFEPGLMQTIQDDLQARPAADAERGYISPTQLQLVCYTLFQELTRGATTIDRALYAKRRGHRQLPGAEGILTGHLQTILTTQLPPDQQAAASLVLQELVSSQSRRVQRTVTALQEQLRLRDAGDAAAQTPRVLDFLQNNRLVSLDQQPVGAHYELTHDYLIGEIESWIQDDERERKRVRELIVQGLDNARHFGAVLDPTMLDLIGRRRSELALDGQAQTLLLRSALVHDAHVAIWLAAAPDPEARQAAVAGALTAGEEVRLRTVEWLPTVLGEAAPATLLAVALTDPADRVRAEAARTAVDSGRVAPDVVHHLTKAATGAETEQSQRAVTALARMVEAGARNLHLPAVVRRKLLRALPAIRLRQQGQYAAAEIGSATVGGMVGGLIFMWLIAAASGGGPVGAIFAAIIFGLPLGFLLGLLTGTGLALRLFFSPAGRDLWGAAGAAAGGFLAATAWYGLMALDAGIGFGPQSVRIFGALFGGLWGLLRWWMAGRAPRLAGWGAPGAMAAALSALLAWGLTTMGILPAGFDAPPPVVAMSYTLLGTSIALGFSRPGRRAQHNSTNQAG